MADRADDDHGPSPAAQAEAVLVAAAAAAVKGERADSAIPTGPGPDANRGVKRPRPSAVPDDDDDDDDKPGRERRKIEIKFIQDKSRRHITFSKRKAGIMKKAYELSVLTGTQVLLLVVSETGLVYTFTTPKLQPLVTKPEGKNLIQACLNAPEPATGNENGVEPESAAESPDEASHASLPPQHPGMARAAPTMQPAYLTQEQQQHMAYQQYLAQQQQAARGSYPMPPQANMATHQSQA
ncbi:MAG: transcription factor of the MADS box [Phylliscum demangeonii]|nr:MAG: transcription factor of the MADS box [Phylliscum demangeonii]